MCAFHKHRYRRQIGFASIWCAMWALYNSCYNTAVAVRSHSLTSTRFLSRSGSLSVYCVCLWRWTTPRMGLHNNLCKEFRNGKSKRNVICILFSIQIRAYKQYISFRVYAFVVFFSFLVFLILSASAQTFHPLVCLLSQCALNAWKLCDAILALIEKSSTANEHTGAFVVPFGVKIRIQDRI